ncbi:U4/U6.U5 tri-snRNP-associated protein 1 isoform X2 [Folsomia candida]|uniref:U4/U6.U5 tri-snRNP-associated protein 1 isoform X2 n=1 Tax=Folsomia candida TaxID=158441 RepID=UPI001605412C|nr:U4/U6.U5 tri-snRNP-associated protein 1 isoform X2 [Folsomia candida]
MRITGERIRVSLPGGPPTALSLSPYLKFFPQFFGSSDDSDVPLSKASRHEERSPSPIEKPSGDGSVLSIHETNKLRAKLGLKPLQVDSGPPPRPQPPPQKRSGKPEDVEEGEAEEEFDEETLRRIRAEREKEGETFWKETQEFVHAPAENLTARLKSDKLKDKLTTMKEKRKLETKMLQSKGLADSDEDDDAHAWVLKQKTLAEQKALAAKRAKELDELDTEFGLGEVVETAFVKHKNKAYTEKDLKGMKVLHDQSRIQDGGQVILTLKDKGVLDEEDDTLVNVNMLDDERYDKNVKNKQLRPELHGYNALDEIEYDESGSLKTKSLLGKYDEEIGGPERQSFVIGQNISEEARKAQIREKMKRADKILESVDSVSLKVMSDFYSPEEMVSFKKPKKKVRKVRKVLRADDLLKLDADGNKAPAGVINQRDLGSRNKKSHAATAVKEEPMDMEIDLEIDDFAVPTEVDISDVKLEDEADIDFQRALHKARKMKQKQLAKPKPKANVGELLLRELEIASEAEKSDAGSIVLHATAEFCRTLGDIPSVDAGDLYGDEEMDFEQEEKYQSVSEERGAWNEVDIDETPVDITRIPDQEEVTILEQEPDVGVGLAGALKLAHKKGFLEQEKVKRVGATTMKHLEAKHYTIEDKNYEEERVSKRDMYFGPTSDFREKDGYKPEVKLEYNDEDGKPISAKEAFRLLSHKFHGKGSGKNKIDKKRKKNEQEKLMQHMNSTDTPLRTVELLQQKQKETHSAYLILSGSKAHDMLRKSKR